MQWAAARSRSCRTHFEGCDRRCQTLGLSSVPPGAIRDGLKMVDAIAALTTVNAGGALGNLPLVSVPAGDVIGAQTMVMMSVVSVVPIVTCRYRIMPVTSMEGGI